MNDVAPIRRALVSVADKSGLLELGRALAEHGVVIVSSGSTAAFLRDGGIEATAVSEVTGFPELLDGRVKTLHPRIHAGILADRRKPAHLEELERLRIEPFDLVVVNLYRFRETVATGASIDEVLEQIDIGGPALVRAAAKNFHSVGVVARPDRYAAVLDEIRSTGGLSEATRLRLAREAFAHTAAYDAGISEWFAENEPSGGVEEDRPEAEWPPERLSEALALRAPLRYGENPHQRAALYESEGGPGPLGGARVIQGKEMSFNNWLDADAARATAWMFEEPCAAIVKHSNPCGVALDDRLAVAYRRALEGDPVSAFGGIVAFNRDVDGEAAAAMSGVFTEVVVAPGYSEGALLAFAARENLRVLEAPPPSPRMALEIRHLDGGALLQDSDRLTESRDDMKVVTTREPTADQWEDLLFAWRVAARVKSNAIVLATGRATVGIGAGQMNRLTSVAVATGNAGERARGSCLASDAFFPFRDGVDRAGEAGVSAIIQPGGSVRDEEVVAAAEEGGMAMVFTWRRHFRH
ncbi:MAG: bifunctional phosphoribosylaminoimidazolecarboxamide formyltransferase/IMP cyclohydrolase [Actinobacteria bacterium]|nr:bifunctional phosphoribosylaminoimidazolecarboxamide formyltransferase/IMP cyclohydrolase [Actinomycetota bacterium]